MTVVKEELCFHFPRCFCKVKINNMLFFLSMKCQCIVQWTLIVTLFPTGHMGAVSTYKRLMEIALSWNININRFFIKMLRSAYFTMWPKFSDLFPWWLYLCHHAISHWDSPYAYDYRANSKCEDMRSEIHVFKSTKLFSLLVVWCVCVCVKAWTVIPIPWHFYISPSLTDKFTVFQSCHKTIFVCPMYIEWAVPATVSPHYIVHNVIFVVSDGGQNLLSL